MSSAPVNVVQFGLGPIGLASARAVLEHGPARGLRLAGAVDIDPAKVGCDLADLLGEGPPTGVTVEPDVAATVVGDSPHVVLHTAGSALRVIRPQLEACLRAGACVVSSAEELLWPFHRHPGLARELDELARGHGVALVGTGVNPGFVLDALVVVSTGVCLSVDRLEARRVVDAAKRREPLQRKVGAGLTTEEFAQRQEAGTIGHVGMEESLRFAAAGLGWKLEAVEDVLQPVVADRKVETPYLTVEPGRVAGVHHATRGYVAGGREALSLDLKMFVGAEDPHDAVRVHGDPPIDVLVRDGIFGDTATVAALMNAVRPIVAAAPGLRTLLDLPLPRSEGS